MYESFEKLLKLHNLTAYRVGKATGIASSTFTDWKNGRSVPKQEKLQKIADFFGVRIEELMGKDITNDTGNSKSEFEERLKILEINEDLRILVDEEIGLSAKDLKIIRTMVKRMKEGKE